MTRSIAKRGEAQTDIIRMETRRLTTGIVALYDSFMDLPEDLRGGVDYAHNPKAAEAIREMEADRQRATNDTIASWLAVLAGGLTTNMTASQMVARNTAIMFALGDLPRICWTDETCKLAMTSLRSGFYPSVPELAAVLQPIADRHKAAMKHAERVRDAPIGGRPIMVESTVPYPVQMPPPEKPSRHKPPPLTEAEQREADADRHHRQYHPPIRTVEQQLAILRGEKAGD